MMVRRSTGQARALRSTYRNVIWTEPSTPSPDTPANPSPPLSEQHRHPHRSVADVFHRRRGRSGDSRPGADAVPAGNTLARPPRARKVRAQHRCSGDVKNRIPGDFFSATLARLSVLPKLTRNTRRSRGHLPAEKLLPQETVR